jgi:hypothetical protein
MDGHGHASVIGNAVGLAEIAGEFNHRVIAKFAEMIFNVFRIRGNSSSIVFGVAGEPKNEAEKFDSWINADLRFDGWCGPNRGRGRGTGGLPEASNGDAEEKEAIQQNLDAR